MATSHNSHQGAIGSLEGQLKVVRGPHPTIGADPAEQLIRDALELLLGALNTTPAGAFDAPSLQHHSFQVTPPTQGFNITIPLPPLGNLLTLPVTPQISWKLTNAKGQTVSPGNGFIADPPALDTVAVQLLFFPQVATDRQNVPNSGNFTLQPSVQLTVTHPVTGAPITEPKASPFELPDIPVQVPVALRIPPILALFRHKSFAPLQGNKKGFAIVFVPASTGVTQAEDLTVDGKLGDLLDEVGVIRSTIESLPVSEQSLLSSFAGNLEGFLDGLNSIVTSLAAFEPIKTPPGTKPPLALLLQESDENLNTETLIPGFFNDIEGENEVSSLIFIGVGETARLYNRRHFKTGQGILQLKVGAQMCAVIDRLDRAKPTATIGGPTITTPGPPNFALRADTFENALASFHFGEKPPE